ncbi:polyprenyl synthetase family protein [Streptomyces sp. NPDC048337]|uniref:polyprenyl synthetase family protein n=1 Tax=Streptomyces sp. NPDC048337 TaxID=3365535 RepID=UPI0037161295
MADAPSTANPRPADDEIRRRVTAALQVLADTRQSGHPELDEALAHLARFLAGGKRMRAAFAYRGWQAAGGKGDDHAVIAVGASLELTHAFALLQDDVIDSSATRRGLPTMHHHVSARHARAHWRGLPDRYGAAVAHLCANRCWGWAGQLVDQAVTNRAQAAAIKAVTDQMLLDGTHGEHLELVLQAQRSFNAARCRQVSHYKTGLIMFKPPLLAGALLTGAEKPLLDAYAAFGTAIGEAYQLRDDLLGVYGDPAVTGKPNLDDLREGKPTPLAAEALQRATPDQSAVFHRLYGRPDLDEEGAGILRSLFRDTGAVTAIEQDITDRLRTAVQALIDAELPAPAIELLTTTARTALDRTH